MYRYYWTMISFLIINCAFAQISTFIHVDQFGYLVEAEKVAVLSNPEVGFNAADSYTPASELEVIHAATAAVVFSGAAELFNNGNIDGKSGDRGWWFDFSALTSPGSYYVYDPVNEERSAVFEISNNPYLQVLKDAGRMFFYNRCNFAKEIPYAEVNWTDGMNFLNDLQDANCRYINDPNNASLEKNLSGGWFDAGDYNKYVTFTESVLHDLLYAYEENSAAFGDDWNIPESGNSIPDLLDEVKWELDWLFKMMNEDGSAHIKMGSRNHNENIASPPSANTDGRYYGPTCTAASATIAGVFAHAALVYRNVEGLEGYAGELTDAAILAFDYVAGRMATNNLEVNCDDGSIVAGDADRSMEDQRGSMVTASVYLFELTEEEVYHVFFQELYSEVEQLSNNFWGADNMVINDALLRYLNVTGNLPSISNEIANSAADNVNQNNNGFWGWQNNDLYRSYNASWAYYWGSNRPKANYGTANFSMADKGIGNDGASLQRKGYEQLHYFHGVNPLGLVMLSNMYERGGEHCVNELYHIWFYDGTDYDHALNSPKGPAPGYVTGGPNSSFSITTISPPANQPDLKSYLDFNTGWPDNSWEISEPAIYYQAAYIRLLARSVPNTDAVTNTKEAGGYLLSFRVFPNPASDWLRLELPEGTYTLSIINEQGQLVRQHIQDAYSELSIAELPSGSYRLEAQATNGKRYHSHWVKQE